MSEFEKQVIEMLTDIKKEISVINGKVNTITEQTAANTELKVAVSENSDQIEKINFELELIKKYLRS